MKLLSHRYYHGANRYAPLSGLALHLQPEEGDTFWRWKPDRSEATWLIDSLHRTFSAMVDTAEAGDADRIVDAPHPAAELILLVVAGVVRDYCADARRGHLVDTHDGRFRLFLPCDEIGIAVGAWGLATRVPEIFNAPSEEDAQKNVLAGLKEAYWSFRRTCLQIGLNPSNIELARAAVARGIPHYRLVGRTQHSQFGQGRHRQRIFETLTEKTGGVARRLVRDKLLTGSMLAASGVPTPGSRAVASEQEAVRVAYEIGWPVVVKPRASGKGRGVSLNLCTPDEVTTAFRGASEYGEVLVERFVEGDEHRMLVVDGRLRGSGQRRPGAVIGDGEHSVQELVDELNTDPQRGLPFERNLQWLLIDEEAHRVLSTQGMSVSFVPARGQEVKLRGTSNISRGGSSVDVTDAVHPDNRRLMERVARIIGLDVAGVDFLTPDIRRSWREVTCAVLGASSTPGLNPHMMRNHGRDVTEAIVEHLFAGGGDGRIPTIGITGGPGRSEVCRLVAHILSVAGSTVAQSTTRGAWVGDEQMQRGDATSLAIIGALLHDPGVDAAVFEFVPDVLAQRGMVLDACDVGIVLALDEGDVGVEGLASVDDLSRVAGIVADTARTLAILDAADARCVAMHEWIRTPRVCLVGGAADDPALRSHLAADGLAAYLDESADAGKQIVLTQGTSRILAVALSDLPDPPGGREPRTVVNMMAACAAAHGLGLEAALIGGAMRSFPLPGH